MYFTNCVEFVFEPLPYFELNVLEEENHLFSAVCRLHHDTKMQDVVTFLLPSAICKLGHVNWCQW